MRLLTSYLLIKMQAGSKKGLYLTHQTWKKQKFVHTVALKFWQQLKNASIAETGLRRSALPATNGLTLMRKNASIAELGSVTKTGKPTT